MTSKLSLEHRRKLSEALKGKKKSKEHIEKMRRSKTGKTYEQLYGKKKEDEMKRNLSIKNSGKNNNMYGKTHTLEARRIISEANKGREGVNKGKHLSKETKEKLSLCHKGKHYSPRTEFKKGHKTWIEGVGHSKETRQKLSKVKMGRKLTKEWREKIGESNKGKNMGKDNGAWNGGTSFGDYDLEFGKPFRNEIRNRDNNSCVICGSSDRLAVHHIDYNKKNTIKENCISLCNSCHSKTNFNRKSWISFFQKYLSENYKYEYTLNNLPIINLVGLSK